MRLEFSGATNVDGLDIDDYILAVFLYARGRLRSKLHLMKVLAAFARLTSREDELGFVPYRMGLYSIEVNDVFTGLVYEEIIERAPHGYQLTQQGWKHAREAAKKLEKALGSDTKLLKQLTENMRKLTVEELLLLHYVFFCDDPCRQRSREWSRIEKKRAEIALKMFTSGRANLQLAAILAGMTQEELTSYAARKGVYNSHRPRLQKT